MENAVTCDASQTLGVIHTLIIRALVVVCLLFALGGVATALMVIDPLLKVAAGFTSKSVCSGVFVSGRDGKAVLAEDVRAPGHPVLGYVTVDIDKNKEQVTTSVLNLPWTRVTARYQTGKGCTRLSGRELTTSANSSPNSAVTTSNIEIWTAGSSVQLNTSERIRVMMDEAAAIPGTRALVAVYHGNIVAERYGNGFNIDTALLGWSLTKTVVSLLVGIAINDGIFSLDDNNLFLEWDQDDRRDITVKHLLHMESGLAFDESSDGVSDATRMLFLESDMSGFALQKPLLSKPGEIFAYASGNSHLLIRLLRQKLGGAEMLHDYLQQRLFLPLGIVTGAFEMDSAGNYVASAFLYLTARDWAKFGVLIQNDGEWDGEQVVPAKWISFMAEASPRSDGEYGGHIWLRGQAGDEGFELPDDAIWFLGHDGQSIAVMPDREWVVVRLGLTPGEDSFKPQVLVQGLLESGEF